MNAALSIFGPLLRGHCHRRPRLRRHFAQYGNCSMRSPARYAGASKQSLLRLLWPDIDKKTPEPKPYKFKNQPNGITTLHRSLALRGKTSPLLSICWQAIRRRSCIYEQTETGRKHVSVRFGVAISNCVSHWRSHRCAVE